MNPFRQYLELLSLSIRMSRSMIWFISMVNVAFAVGLVVGFGYVIPDISRTTALFLVTGTATQMIVTVALVALPTSIAEAKRDGRLEFLFTLPISREAYLLAQMTFVFLLSLPAIVFAVGLGAWKYGFALELSPWVLVAVPLATLSLAGLGVLIAVLSPHFQLTNAITQLAIFYVLFFAPVIFPREQLPAFLQHVGDFLPASHAADAMRATMTDLPGTHLLRSLLVMAAFAAGSLGLASAAARRRG